MIVFPNAKINLGLHVISKRPDGYHNLETVFYPVQLADALEMVEADQTGLSVSGIAPDIPSGKNLVLKACALLQAEFDLPPVHFHLHKIIPNGAGLGGGSSDAAFTLKMLNDFYELGLGAGQLKKYASKIGADCPFFIGNQPTFAEGTGNRLNPCEVDLSDFHFIIAKPDVSVSTSEAYSRIVPSGSELNLKEILSLPPEKWKDNLVNDFEYSVFKQYPEIEHLKNSLYKAGAAYASMSGSGSAVYGIFRHLPSDIHRMLPEGIFVYS